MQRFGSTSDVWRLPSPDSLAAATRERSVERMFELLRPAMEARQPFVAPIVARTEASAAPSGYCRGPSRGY